jgi:hypothetical protein
MLALLVMEARKEEKRNQRSFFLLEHGDLSLTAASCRVLQTWRFSGT